MTNYIRQFNTITAQHYFMVVFFLLIFILLMGTSRIQQQSFAQTIADTDVVEMMPIDSDLNIRASVVVGIDPKEPFRRERAWVPVRIELNNMDDDFEGELILQLKNGQITYQTPVSLPSRSRQLFTMYVYLPEGLDEIEFYLQSGRKKIAFQVVTVAAPSYDSTRFIAVLSPTRGSHEHLGHREENERVEIFRNVVYTSPLYLPKSWVGMQNIDVLVWDGAEDITLTPDQEEAIDHWIQMGGTLVLACGENWQKLETSSLRLYSPVTMTGSTVLPAKQVLNSNKENSESVIQPSVVAATGDLLDDPKLNIRLTAGEIPFLVERPWGAGKIVWVASSLQTPLFDPLYQELFMRYLSSNNLTFSPSSLDQLDASITSFLRWLVQAELPSTAFVAMYLGLYIIILVPVNYLVFRSIKRLEWAWFTIPVWALVFAYGAYYIGSFSQHSVVITNQISLIESKPNANYGSATTFCSVYSPLRKWYTLRFEDPKAFPMIPAESNFRQQSMASNEDLTVSFDSNSNSIEDFLIYHWSQRVFKAQHSVQVGEGVDLNIHFKENRLEGDITNNTPFTLTSAKLFLKDRIIPLPNLAPGESADVSGKWRNAQRFDASMNWQMMQQMDFGRRNRDMGQFIRDRLEDAYAQYYYQSSVTKGTALFAAQTDLSSLHFMIERDEIQPTGQSLFCVMSDVEQVMRCVRTVEPHEWQFGYSANNNMGYGGFGGMPNNQFIPVQGQPEAYAELYTDLPLEFGKIRWLKLKIDDQQLQRYRAGNQRQNNAQPVQKKEGFYVRNRTTNRYMHVDDITDENGIIANPEQYVDKLASKIQLQYSNQSNNYFQIPREAINVTMEVDYGDESDESFLGYSLELERDI
jgi:hypothetical protein